MIGAKKSAEDFTLSSLSLVELNRVLIRIGELLSQAHGIGQHHDMHGSRIVNVGSPAQTRDAINKQALDDGLEPKTEGPDSSTDNAVVRWDGNDGRKLQNSLALIDDAGSVNIPAGQTYKIGGVPHTHAFDDLSDVDFTAEARGDLVFRGADKWNNLPAGDAGQVLTSRGDGADPTWEDLPGVEWQEDTDEWIYGSDIYNYFYIANKDVTCKFPPGTKIKLTQTTEKFWYVDYSAVGELGHTSVVLVANSDYTLVDAPITNPCYSYDINPEGFPWDFTDDVATAIHVVDNKATPVDSDELGLGDSADSYGLKKTYWSDIKGTLKTYFDTLYTVDLATLIHGATEKPSLADNDEFPMTDSADTYALKKMLASDLKAALKTYFDTQYLASMIPYWPDGYWPDGYWPDGYWSSETLMLAEIVSSISLDGWHKDGDTWIYGSSSYFYIAGKNVTARFPRGTKISIIQGGTVKYWYVNYSEFSYGNTSVVLALTPDFTLENAAITSPRYSYASNPQGFPACFTHSDSWDGFSTNPSGGCCNYSVEGGMVTLNVYRAVDGTADANNCTINLPLESRDAANYVAFSFGYTVKEATLALGFAYVTQKSYGATLICAPGAAATDWNTSGDKNWVGQIRYHL